MAKEKRKIRIRRFDYDLDEHGVGKKFAVRGQEVELDETDIGRGNLIGAFASQDDKPVTEKLSIRELPLPDVVGWIEGEGSEKKPTIQEIIDASEGESDLAQKLLDAETSATGGQPRKGVVKGLAAVIERDTGGQDEDEE